MKYILGIGSPLLDIVCPIDQKFLSENGMKMNNAILAEPKHMHIFDKLIAEPNSKISSGGSTLNSVRVCQWILRKEMPNTTRFFGCVGDDKNGEFLKKIAEKDGVETSLMKTTIASTGVCVVGIMDKERSAVTSLGAANKFCSTYLEKAEIKQKYEECSIYYSSGFFLTVSFDSIQKIAQHSAQNNKIFAMSFSANFIVENFGEQLQKILTYADYVFMSEEEARCYGAKYLSNKKDVQPENVAKAIADLPYAKTEGKRTVIITRGPNSTIVNMGGIEEFECGVDKIDENEIIDLSAAGDAFVGGFLAGLSKEKTTKECVMLGHKAAGKIIRRSGATIEDDFE